RECACGRPGAGRRCRSRKWRRSGRSGSPPTVSSRFVRIGAAVDPAAASSRSSSCVPSRSRAAHTSIGSRAEASKFTRGRIRPPRRPGRLPSSAPMRSRADADAYRGRPCARRRGPARVSGSERSSAGPASSPEEAVLLVLPTGRDAALAQNALAAAELSCEPCSGLGELADRLHGAAGVILAEEALRHSGPLFAALDAEPPGSALPVCVLLARRGPTPAARFALRALERHPKVLPSFLARPCTPAALVGAARAGLRARQTQERLR